MARTQQIKIGNTIPPIQGNERDSVDVTAELPVNGVNCGLINESLLTPYNSSSVDTVTIPDGTDLTNKIIYGDVSLPSTITQGITGRNFLCVGGNHVPTSNKAVLNLDNSRSQASGDLIDLRDFEIRPRRESLNRDGIRGWGFRIYRPYIHATIDGFGLYKPSSSNIDVQWHGGLIEDLAYFYPDYDNGTSGGAEHSDGVHGDCGQVHGGDNWEFVGIFFNGTGHLSQYSDGAGPTPWLQQDGWSSGAGLIVTDDTGYSSTAANAKLLDCWFRGAKSNVNVKPNLSFTALRNKHFTAGPSHSGSPGTWSTYYWRWSPTSPGSGVYAAIAGMNTSNGTIANTTNKWWDGAKAGQLLAAGRTSGTTFD